MKTQPPFPTSGGSYRAVDGQLVREDVAPVVPAAIPADPIDPPAPAADPEPTPAARGRKSRED